MANFRYQVLDVAGKQSSGVLEAQSIADASRKLKAEGRYVLKVELDRGPGLMNLEIGSKRLNTKELVLISRQLASLLSAGITIVRSLDMLYQQMETKRSKKCCTCASNIRTVSTRNKRRCSRCNERYF